MLSGTPKGALYGARNGCPNGDLRCADAGPAAVAHTMPKGKTDLRHPWGAAPFPHDGALRKRHIQRSGRRSWSWEGPQRAVAVTASGISWKCLGQEVVGVCGNTRGALRRSLCHPCGAADRRSMSNLIWKRPLPAFR
jgi:hypothetical protein